MPDFGEALERREYAREHPDAVCELLVADRTHDATVVDVSRGGIFVTSTAPLWPGALVRVRARNVERYAMVLRERQIPFHLRNLLPRGFGLRWIASGESH